MQRTLLSTVMVLCGVLVACEDGLTGASAPENTGRPVSQAERDAAGPGAAAERSDRADAGGQNLAVADDCRGSVLEPDAVFTALSGPGVVDGQLQPGEYVLSTTYLRMHPGEETYNHFAELAFPAIADARQRDGLLAAAFGLSQECSSARTLTVWRDQQAMYQFVAGPVHAAAMAAVGELSRGGTIAMHWLGDETEANWEAAAAQLGAFDGQTY